MTDCLIRLGSFLGNSMPNFFVALLLMYVFSIRLKLFPVLSNSVSLRGAILPALTLAIAMSAKYLRQVRAAVLDELEKDYVAGARARGCLLYTSWLTVSVSSVFSSTVPIIFTGAS